jgi:putative ABC transport system substrate-binding protein
VAAVLAVAGASRGATASGPVVVVRTSDLGPYKAVEAAFTGALDRPAKSVSAADGAEGVKAALAESPALVLAIGPEAAKMVSDLHPAGPNLFALVPNPERYTDAKGRAVPMFASSAQVARVIHQLLPKAKTLGIIYDPAQSKALVEDCARAASSSGLTLSRQEVGSRQEVAGAVRNLVGKVDALWVVPDATVIGADTFKFMVQTSLESHLPLVGFSQGMTKAGAVLSVEAEYAEMGKNAARAAHRALSGQSPDPEAPTGSLYLNAKSADLLGVEIPDGLKQQAKQVIQ